MEMIRYKLMVRDHIHHGGMHQLVWSTTRISQPQVAKFRSSRTCKQLLNQNHWWENQNDLLLHMSNETHVVFPKKKRCMLFNIAFASCNVLICINPGPFKYVRAWYREKYFWKILNDYIRIGTNKSEMKSAWSCRIISSLILKVYI